jgi:actin-related protein/chromosome segregation ATPase
LQFNSADVQWNHFSARFSKQILTLLEYENILIPAMSKSLLGISGDDHTFGKSLGLVVESVYNLAMRLFSEQEIGRTKLVDAFEDRAEALQNELDELSLLYNAEREQQVLDKVRFQTELSLMQTEVDRYRELQRLEQIRAEEAELKQASTAEDQLDPRLDELMMLNSALRTELAEVRSMEGRRCMELSSKLEHRARECEKFQAEIRFSSAQLAAVQTQLDACTADSAQQNEVMERKVAALLSELDTVAATLQERTDQCQQHMKKIHELESLQDALLSKSGVEEANWQTMITELKATNQFLKNQLSDRLATEAVALDERDSLALQLKSTNELLMAAQKQLRDVTSELAMTKEQGEMLVDELDKLKGSESDLAALTAELEFSKEAAAEAQSTAEDLMDNLSVSRRKVDTQTKEITDLKVIATEGATARATLEMRLTELEAVHSILKATSTELQSKLDGSSQSVATKDEQIKMLHLELNLTKSQDDQLKSANSSLLDEILDLRSRCDALPSVVSQVEELQTTNIELQEMLDMERKARRSSTAGRPSSLRLQPASSTHDLFRSNSGRKVDDDWDSEMIVSGATAKPNDTDNEMKVALEKKHSQELQSALQHKQQLTEENDILVDKILELQTQLAAVSSKSNDGHMNGNLAVVSARVDDDDDWTSDATAMSPLQTGGRPKSVKLTPPPLKGPTSPVPADKFLTQSGSLSPLSLQVPEGRSRANTNNGDMTPSTTPKKNQRMDQQFSVEAAAAPLVVIEVGTFVTRISQWSNVSNSFHLKYVALFAKLLGTCVDIITLVGRFQCRTMKATAQNDNNRFDVVRFASSQSDRMFQKFREDGMFVGADAYYVCFDHPDRGLRGSLKQLPIIQSGRILDLTALDQLLEDLLIRGALVSDASGLQVLMTYKLTYRPDDMCWIIQTLFEKLQCNKVCMLSEPYLLCRSVPDYPESCTVVDIGEYETRIYCYYEGMLLDNATSVTNVGGNHLTEFLALLLHAKHVEAYGTLLPRRCKEVAREVKEKISFVAIDFLQAQELYGYFEFESVRVMRPELLEASYQQGLLKYDPSANVTADMASKRDSGVTATRTKLAAEIQKNIDIRLPDGVVISFLLDVERFNCAEVLFMPALFEDCRSANSIVEEFVHAIDIVDESIREDVCANVIIAGGTRTIPGLATRVELELRQQVNVLKSRPDGFVRISGQQNSVDAIPAGPTWRDSDIGGPGSAVIIGAGSRILSAEMNSDDDSIDVLNFMTSIDFEALGSTALYERLV